MRRGSSDAVVTARGLVNLLKKAATDETIGTVYEDVMSMLIACELGEEKVGSSLRKFAYDFVAQVEEDADLGSTVL